VSIEHQRRVLRALGLLPPEQAEQPEEPGLPSFDGGARETPPLPSDPEADHGQTVVQIIQRSLWGEGGW
jgi:hypothetical protein